MSFNFSSPKGRLSHLVELAGSNPSGFDIRYTDVGFVPQYSLCTMCATCEGICPHGAIHMCLSPDKGIYEPIVDSSLCTACGLCVECCPGYGLDLLHERPASQAGMSVQSFIGACNGIFRAHSTQEGIRSNGASGGMVTGVLSYLFEQGLINGAVVLRMDPNHPLEVLPYIAYNTTDLLASQRSKYCPTPMNTILKRILKDPIKGRRFAYVGLPCHIEGLRLAQARIPRLRRLFPFVFSLFCHETPTLWATKYLMYKNSIKTADLKKIIYRSGHHPSHLCFLLKNGQRISVPHLHWTYWGFTFMNYFCPARCWLCYDKTGEFADLSFGDDWQSWWSESLGESTVVTRSVDGNQLIEKMAQDGYITAQSLTVDEFIKGHNLLKEGNIAPRLKVWQLLKRPIPLYIGIKLIGEQGFLELFDSLRASFRVILGERHVSESLMDRIIWSGWQWQRTKSCLGRIARSILIKSKKVVKKLLNYCGLFPTTREKPKK